MSFTVHFLTVNHEKQGVLNRAVPSNRRLCDPELARVKQSSDIISKKRHIVEVKKLR